MLTLEGCRQRQDRFIAALDEKGLGGALIAHPRDIYYLTGIWVEDKNFDLPSLLFLGPGKPSWLASWRDDGEAVVDERDYYPADLLATVNPDNVRRLASLGQAYGRGHQGRLGRVGFQAESGGKHLLDCLLQAAGVNEIALVDDVLAKQQAVKDSDELDLLRMAAKVNEAAYARAVEVIEPGVSELDVLAECRKAAQMAAGKPIYFGGDFRSNAAGGPARDRALEAGEIYIIDAQVDLDGYWSDLSRAWVVGSEPTDLQQSVYEHLEEILRDVPSMVKVGGCCVELWKEIDSRIREHEELGGIGLSHHGGHGIGLRAHEAPDVSSQRDGTFAVGAVFTIEPGVYFDQLRYGIRLEDNFVLTEDGVVLLSDVPFGLSLAETKATTK